MWEGSLLSVSNLTVHYGGYLALRDVSMEVRQGETVCGLALSRSQLVRFGGVRWVDVQPDSGGAADLVQAVCDRCAAALRPGTGRTGAGWRRTSPRP